MSRSAVLSFSTLAAVGLLAAGVVYSDKLTAEPAMAAEAPAAPPAPQVGVVTVTPQAQRIWTQFPARLEAVETVDLKPQVSGRLIEQRFEDGQIVQQGDVLFVIDPRPFEAAVQQAESSLAAARQSLDFAEKELVRARSLVKRKAISESTFDQRVNDFELAKIEIKAAEARLTQAKLDLEYAYVRAPITGRVSRAELTVGNLVTAAAAPTLTTIVTEDKIYADFHIDEATYLSFVRNQAQSVDQERQIPVQLSIVAGTETISHSGQIYAFDNKINPNTGSIRARALFSNEDGYLIPGMFAQVNVGSATEESLIILPEDLIMTDQSRKFVLVVSEENQAQYRPVQLGATLETGREILSGLAEGDRVVSSGLMHVRPNMTVTVAPSATAAE